MMLNIGTKILLPLRLCAKHNVKYPSLNFLLHVKNQKSSSSIFTRSLYKQIEDPNQSNSFKNALEFVKAHPAKSIQATKLNIKGTQLCWALAIFLNNQEAYPFLKHIVKKCCYIDAFVRIFKKNNARKK